ncbi:CBS domain-containing protein [Streptomyces virginiae]|uniref:CBS domain-containing protein n=1 Tax=Streptomyces virginiae TaxID=1961 RepID=UPI002DB7B13B|nr:CBS domain-containing protein [Streptomyces sp. CMAA1738]MEC4570213.1 CBS domain-containing protein [Streptomyces sp. CMAA1738]
MKHLRTVNDVMTHAVVSVDRDMPVHDIVGAMRRWGFSSLPVVSAEGRVVGVVSEADLLAKAEGTDDSHRVTAGQLMTVPPVTVPKDATIAGAARLMARGPFKRLPVVDGDGGLVGVVSRGDLLKIYLRPDGDIAEELRDLLTARLIPSGSAIVHVHVDQGVVRLEGEVSDPGTAEVLVRVARAVPGVVDVQSRLHAQVPA